MYSTADTAEAVGCPIRKSTDQSLLAAPRGLSQRAASFIASQCQGIHQMPFRRLISTYGCVTRRRKPARIRQRCIIMTQPTARPTAGTTALSGHPRSRILFTCQRSHTRLGGYLCSLPRISWSSVGRRHDMSSFLLPCLPGGGGRDRTDDLMLAKHALSQLSYAPEGRMVGLGRLELPTSRLSSARSNQLSYKPRPVPDARSPARSRLSSGPAAGDGISERRDAEAAARRIRGSRPGPAASLERR